MPEKDPLDLLIDSALATYAEAPAGLEDRVLGACAAARSKSPAKPLTFPVRRVFPWLIALSAAACLLFALFVHNHSTSHPTQSRTSAPPQIQPMQRPPSVVATRHQRRTPRHLASGTGAQQVVIATQSTPAPKLDVFPTPQPLSAQERTLVAIATRTPVPLRKALVEAQSQPDAPLHIAEISIPPIKPPDQVQP
jgi:hypothetical protein